MSDAALTKAFAFYGAYHSNPINQHIHIICVPAIYTTALSFLTRVPLAAAPRAAAGLLAALGERPGAVSAALPAALGYAGYYLALALPRRPLLGAAAAALALGALPLAHWLPTLGAGAMGYVVAVHVASWVAQFYGHGVHEGRSPALLDNLWRASRGRGGESARQPRKTHHHLTPLFFFRSTAEALVMAPFFVLMETLMHIGLLADFKREVDPIIAKAIADFRKSKSK